MVLDGLLVDEISTQRMAEQPHRTGGDYAPPWVWAEILRAKLNETCNYAAAANVYPLSQGRD